MTPASIVAVLRGAAVLGIVAALGMSAADAGGAEPGTPVPLDLAGLPPAIAAVRPADDPLAPGQGRSPPIALFDAAPKTLFCCGGHRFVQGGKLKPPLMALLDRWFAEQGMANPYALVVPGEDHRGGDRTPERGPDDWGGNLAKAVTAAKAAGRPLVALCDWDMGFIGWKGGAPPKREDPAAPPSPADIDTGLALLERFCAHAIGAGADLLVLGTYPGRGIATSKTEAPHVPGAIVATDTDYRWTAFAALEAKRPERIFWGPNGYAVNKDRPYLWAKDGAHWNDRELLAWSWLVYLLRLDGRPVPPWAQEGFRLALSGQPSGLSGRR